MFVCRSCAAQNHQSCPERALSASSGRERMQTAKGGGCRTTCLQICDCHRRALSKVLRQILSLMRVCVCFQRLLASCPGSRISAVPPHRLQELRGTKRPPVACVPRGTRPPHPRCWPGGAVRVVVGLSPAKRLACAGLGMARCAWACLLCRPSSHRPGCPSALFFRGSRIARFCLGIILLKRQVVYAFYSGRHES
jgi:hypothetical protein